MGAEATFLLDGGDRFFFCVSTKSLGTQFVCLGVPSLRSKRGERTTIVLSQSKRFGQASPDRQTIELPPASPDRLPAGFAVALPRQESTQSGNFTPELANRPALQRTIQIGCENRHVPLRCAGYRRPIWIHSCLMLQLQKTHSFHGQNTDARPQAFCLFQLSFLCGAAGLQALVIFLNQPAK